MNPLFFVQLLISACLLIVGIYILSIYISKKISKRSLGLKARYRRNYKIMRDLERSNRDLLNANEWEYVKVVRPINIPTADKITKDTIPTVQEYTHPEYYRKIVSYQQLSDQEILNLNFKIGKENK